MSVNVAASTTGKIVQGSGQWEEKKRLARARKGFRLSSLAARRLMCRYSFFTRADSLIGAINTFVICRTMQVISVRFISHFSLHTIVQRDRFHVCIAIDMHELSIRKSVQRDTKNRDFANDRCVKNSIDFSLFLCSGNIESISYQTTSEISKAFTTPSSRYSQWMMFLWEAVNKFGFREITPKFLDTFSSIISLLNVQQISSH